MIYHLNVDRIKRIFADSHAIITNDHFVYAKKEDGWHHGANYVNKDAVYAFPRYVSELCKEFAIHFSDFFSATIPEVVVGPTGAVNLAQVTSHWLATTYNKEVLAVCADQEDILESKTASKQFGTLSNAAFEFAAQGNVQVEVHPSALLLQGMVSFHYFEKVGTRRVIKRGYNTLVKGKRCLVVEDIVHTGKTVKDTIKAIDEAGGKVMGVGALCNCSGGRVTAQTLDVPELFSLLNLDMQMFKEEDCPICKEKGVASVRTDLGKGKEFLMRIGQL